VCTRNTTTGKQIRELTTAAAVHKRGIYDHEKAPTDKELELWWGCWDLNPTPSGDISRESLFSLTSNACGLGLTNVVERQVLNIDSTHSKYWSR